MRSRLVIMARVRFPDCTTLHESSYFSIQKEQYFKNFKLDLGLSYRLVITL